ncbi:hypothetical protein C8J56DRAFT_1042183 [Mycena floridula]|nr:hypothetical protein C8J56DRAFT_1042183 [Mycena floridula]
MSVAEAATVPPKPEQHPACKTTDFNLVFQAGEYLFCFREAKLVEGEGRSVDKPIVFPAEQPTWQQMLVFWQFLNATPAEMPALSRQFCLNLLDIADRFICDTACQFAIEQLDSMLLTPLEKLTLARRYTMTATEADWIKDALEAFWEKPVITSQEKEIIGDAVHDKLTTKKTKVNHLCGLLAFCPLIDTFPFALGYCNAELTVENHDFSFLDSITEFLELVVGDWYRIHIAEYQGKVAAVKVYEGPDSKEVLNRGRYRFEQIYMVCLFVVSMPDMWHHDLSHPNIVRYIDYVTMALPLFAVGIIPGCSSRDQISMGLNSLLSYLADVLHYSEKDSLIAGAQLMRDVTSGLDHISKCLSLSGIKLDLFVKKDKICISLGVGELDQARDGAGGHLLIYHELCHEAFQEANRECHFDKHKVVNNSEDSETESNSDSNFNSWFDSDFNSDSDSESLLSHMEVVEDESKPTLPQ